MMGFRESLALAVVFTLFFLMLAATLGTVIDQFAPHAENTITYVWAPKQ
jgi:hypothetical protein